MDSHGSSPGAKGSSNITSDRKFLIKQEDGQTVEKKKYPDEQSSPDFLTSIGMTLSNLFGFSAAKEKEEPSPEVG